MTLSTFPLVPLTREPMCTQAIDPGGVKQVTTLPWHFTPKGALFGPIYGIYVE